mgnify:CR=1 FL=1
MLSMRTDQWFPAAEDRNVMGRFIEVESVDVAKTKDAEAKGEEIPPGGFIITRPALASKVVGSHDESVQLVKPFNARELQSRFPGAWEHFQKLKAQQVTGEGGMQVVQTVAGTPLDKADFLPRDRMPWLALQGIQTIEQLRDLSDQAAQNMGRDVVRWRKQADQFLKRT